MRSPATNETLNHYWVRRMNRSPFGFFLSRLYLSFTNLITKKTKLLFHIPTYHATSHLSSETLNHHQTPTTSPTNHSIKGLNDPYKGGLGAYALTVMAAAVCQRHALQPPTEKPSIGMLLASFLEVYGQRGLDPRRSCVSLSPAGPLLPLAPHHFNTPRVGSAG